MGPNTKTITLLAAMALTFAILPTLVAAAAEPLPDDTYEVVADGESYGFTVTDGIPTVDASVPADVEFDFRFRDGDVLDAFDLRVGDVVYEVRIKDGEVKVDLVDDGEDDGGTFTIVLPTGDPDDPTEEPLAAEDDGDEAAGGADGDVVSMVAHCAPRGRLAKALDLPTHGYFVSAAAAGATVSVELDGASTDYDFSDMAAVEDFCAFADGLELPEEDEPGANGRGQEKQQDKDTGKPEDTGRPEDAGKPAHAGPKDKGND